MVNKSRADSIHYQNTTSNALMLYSTPSHNKGLIVISITLKEEDLIQKFSIKAIIAPFNKIAYMLNKYLDMIKFING